ncbi:uncharacterized protein LOC131221230 [Magnolia sinica]|uniref:uncharacterized protein LOC131221230 n=1 Tax=Magnolia sinica TaxID=86752 RepID=UPI00265A7EBD|nr:uncharacterized protein LOC131221230 [Magnolia sinica]
MPSMHITYHCSPKWNYISLKLQCFDSPLSCRHVHLYVLAMFQRELSMLHFSICSHVFIFHTTTVWQVGAADTRRPCGETISQVAYWVCHDRICSWKVKGLVDIFRAKIADISEHSLTIEECNLQLEAPNIISLHVPNWQVSHLFAEWCRICELPGMNDASYAHYISQLQQSGLLKGDDITDRFFCILTANAFAKKLGYASPLQTGLVKLQALLLG